MRHELSAASSLSVCRRCLYGHTDGVAPLLEEFEEGRTDRSRRPLGLAHDSGGGGGGRGLGRGQGAAGCAQVQGAVGAGEGWDGDGDGSCCWIGRYRELLGLRRERRET